MKNKEQGITLIALVVTIILIMIVAGVSISSLTGRNGILTRAVEAKKLTEAKSEEEAIQLIAILFSMESNLKNSNDYYIGKKLYDKTLANGNKWNIIILNDSQKKYGTGWNYIQKGTNIDSYGVTKNNSLNETKDTNVVETSINLENNNGIEAINMPEMPVNPEITGEKSNQSSSTSSSSGMGLIAAALAIGLSAIGSGIAVAVVASSAVGAISENPSLLGKTVIFAGLAEGIAIYGLIIAIMIISKV